MSTRTIRAFVLTAPQQACVQEVPRRWQHPAKWW